MKDEKDKRNILRTILFYFVFPLVIVLLGALLWYPPIWTQNSTKVNSQALPVYYIDGVNINTATVEDLLVLPGIGEKKANSIIEYRNEHGLFTKAEDLLQVPGISKKLLEGISYMLIF